MGTLIEGNLPPQFLLTTLSYNQAVPLRLHIFAYNRGMITYAG